MADGKAGMLNLARIFEDGIYVFRNFSSYLTVPPLPAAVFMMQRDVVNHYRHALKHYLTVDLDAGFLQNSSRGTPYEKWAIVTNEDFGLLSFTVHNLVRYTGRLGHETEIARLQPWPRNADIHRSRIRYIWVTGALRRGDDAIGLRVEADHVLVRTAFDTVGILRGRIESGDGEGRKGGTHHITVDSEGAEHSEPISEDQVRELLRVLRPERIDISDRAVLEAIQSDGMREVEVLDELSNEFGELCREYYGSSKVASQYQCMHESWWI